MPSLDFKVDFDLEKSLATVYGQPMVFHCHHYNTFLQQTIEDPTYLDSTTLLTDAAAEVAFEQMIAYYRTHPEAATPQLRLAAAAEMFKVCGFGTLDLTQLSDQGGTAVAPHSHYALGWTSKFGQRETPACFFVAGYIAGALAAAFGRPQEAYRSTETSCAAAGAACCSFSVEVK
jgi:hypothetical protein